MQAVGKGDGDSGLLRTQSCHQNSRPWLAPKSSKGLAKSLSQTPALRVSDSEHQEWGLYRRISKKTPKDAIKGKPHY